MSEPKRYGDSDPQISCQEDDNGEYVLWTDYEKLRAENADLRAKMDNEHEAFLRVSAWLFDRDTEIRELKKKMAGMVCRKCHMTPQWIGPCDDCAKESQ